MMVSIEKLDRWCLIIVIIVSITCGSWAMNLAIKQQRQIRQENDLLAKQSNDLNLAKANLQCLKTALAATQGELRALNEQVPDSANMGAFLKHLDSSMKLRRIELIGFQPLPIAEEKLYTIIPLRLMFKGSFIDIFHLIRDLETMHRVLVMEEIHITKPNIAQECHVDLVANIFEH